MAVHYHAECLRDGVHQEADPAAAAVWFGKAVELGHYGSLCDLGILHIEGQGVAKAPQRGLELCDQAARMGIPSAQLQLAQLYLAGDESVRRPEAARVWFEQSAQRSTEAQY